MKQARIVVGANYGDEGKGTVVANLTKRSEGSVLNILTNGGAQRGHSIVTEHGSTTFQHFGSGTYHGADSYYSRFFILNPMQFVKEYNSLIVKPKHIYRDRACRWSTPYDSMANLIMESLKERKASCGMGIWNTIKRYKSIPALPLDDFIASENPFSFLIHVKQYYETQVTIPDDWKQTWNSQGLMNHFLDDCRTMVSLTEVVDFPKLEYDNLIFENGQGLLLCDRGQDSYDTTPSNTGIAYAINMLKPIKDIDLQVHYVTRPYLTRHGDGFLKSQVEHRNRISSSIEEDRTNHYNEFQGDFRYGELNLENLRYRIISDCGGNNFSVDVTHCDEMDRTEEFKEKFAKVNVYDSALIK